MLVLLALCACGNGGGDAGQTDAGSIPCGDIGGCGPAEVCYSQTCDSVAYGLGQCMKIGSVYSCGEIPQMCIGNPGCACLSMVYKNACMCQEPRRVDCLYY